MRRRFGVLVAIIPVTLAACGGREATAPIAHPAAPVREVSGSDLHDGHVIPGALGHAGTAPSASRQPLACDVVSPLSESATIGPEGGELDIGPHRLYVPPGALTKRTTLSAMVDAGPSVVIHFYPTGLQFQKPAGLVFDASSCGSVPNVLYLDEQGGLLEEIQAVYSNWWHRIAAPLDHFSNYALEV